MLKSLPCFPSFADLLSLPLVTFLMLDLLIHFFLAAGACLS